jgi:hypothetical protein
LVRKAYIEAVKLQTDVPEICDAKLEPVELSTVEFDDPRWGHPELISWWASAAEFSLELSLPLKVTASGSSPHLQPGRDQFSVDGRPVTGAAGKTSRVELEWPASNTRRFGLLAARR